MGHLDTNVVCRQLGFEPAATFKTLAYFGQGSGPINFDDVECQGFEETLQGCSKHLGPGDCYHGEDVGIICQEPEPYSVRLVWGGSNLEGRVEVYMNNAWMAVCDDTWNTNDATVVCRQLGYDSVNSIVPYDRILSDNNMIYAVSCSGSESKLKDCILSRQPCIYGNAAGVRCLSNAEEGDVRLVGGLEAYQGRVEIFMNDQWGSICPDKWSLTDADVVCKQLGYSGAENTGSNYGSGTGFIYNANCREYETTLKDCIHFYDQDTRCSYYLNTASVDCTRPVETTDSSSLSTGAVIGIVIASISVFVVMIVVLAKCLVGRHQTISRRPATHNVPTVSGVIVSPLSREAVPQAHLYNGELRQEAPPSYAVVLANEASYPKVPTVEAASQEQNPPPSYPTGPAENQTDSPSEHQYETVLGPEDERSTSNLLI